MQPAGLLKGISADTITISSHQAKTGHKLSSLFCLVAKTTVQ